MKDLNLIRQTTSNYDGSAVWFMGDVNGAPWASVTVYQDGNYSLKEYGAYHTGLMAHDKILKVAKPTGQNITFQKWAEGKRK